MSKLFPKKEEVVVETPKETKIEQPVVETTEGEVVRFGEVVNCGSLNIREKPSMSAKVIGTVKAGEKVTIDWSVPPTRTGDFYKLADGGYCRREYIKIR